MKSKIRSIVIVEDDSALRTSLGEMLASVPGWKIVSSFANAELALPYLIATPPDVVLMDIQLPGMSGLECTAAVKGAHPQVQVLVLTVFDNAERVFNALAAGASGYLLKRDAPKRLRDSLDDLLSGGSPISSDVACKLFQHFKKDVSALPGPDYKLTPREHEILELLAHAKLYKEIASDLSISTETVRFHINNIYKKLHVRTRTEAILKHLGH